MTVAGGAVKTQNNSDKKKGSKVKGEKGDHGEKADVKDSIPFLVALT